MTIQIPSWLFNLHCSLTYMTLWLHPWVPWSSTLHYIDYIVMTQSSDVTEATHDTTQHVGTCMHIFPMSFMLNYCVVEWWVCPLCTIASPLRGRVCGVFNGLGVHFIFHACACVSFSCYLVRFMCLSICKQVSWHELHFHPIHRHTMSRSCTCICNHSWQDNMKSKNIPVYHQL